MIGLVEIAPHHIGRDGILVDVGLDRDDPLAVHPADGRVAASHGGLGHVGERHLAAGRGADAHILQVAQRAPLALRVTHHDPDIVAAPLNTLGFLTVESLTHLATQVGQGQPERLRLRFDCEFELLFAETWRYRGCQRRRNISEGRP